MPENDAPSGAAPRSDAPLRLESPGGPPPKYALLLLTVSLGGVLAPLNSTMLTVALPELRDDFSVGHAGIAWLVSAYLIAMAVAQPLGGRLGDQLGRATVFRTGLIAFLALSLACAAAPSFPLLILFRTGQALVGATVIPNGMAMLRESLPPNQLGRSGGFTGSAIAISAGVGPLLGAGLLALGSWRLLFLMNIPLVAAALVCQALLAYRAPRERTRFNLDWIGGLSLAALLVTITFLLNALSGDQTLIVVVAAMTALIVSLAIFVSRQFSAPNPVVEWRLFRIRSYSAATVYIALGNLVMYTTLLTIPFFIKEVQNGGSGRTGLLLTAISLPMIFISPFAGRASDALGRRPLVTGGSVLLAASAGALAFGLDEGSSYPFLASMLVLLGIGMSFSFGSASAAAIESTPRSMAGTAAGTNSMMRYLGSIVGAGILGAVLNTDSGAPGIGLFHLIFAVLLAMSVLAFVSSLFIHRFPPEISELTRQASPVPDRVEASAV